MSPPSNVQTYALLLALSLDTKARKQKSYEEFKDSITSPLVLDDNQENKEKEALPDANGEEIVLLEKKCDLELYQKANSDEEKAEEDFQNWFEGRDMPNNFNEVTFGHELENLVEVFDVRIICNARKNSMHKIHGTISIHSAYGVFEIFRKTGDNPDDILPHGSLTLTDPNVATLGYDEVAIELDIKEGDCEVSNGDVLWHESFRNCYKDEIVTEKVKGLNGFALVTYAVFTNALLISVEINLPNRGNLIFPRKFPTEIYGRIDTSITGLVGSRTTLFRKKRNNCAIVSYDGGLPLSKSLIVLPFGRSFEIRLHLDENLPFNSTNSHIATSVVQFDPKRYGDYEGNVHSKYGPISIKIIAYPPKFHPNTYVEERKFWDYLLNDQT